MPVISPVRAQPPCECGPRDGSPHRCGQEPGTSSALCCWFSGRIACSPMLHSSPSRASQGSGAPSTGGTRSGRLVRRPRGARQPARRARGPGADRIAAAARCADQTSETAGPRSLRELRRWVPALPRPRQANAGKLAGRHQGHGDGPNVLPCAIRYEDNRCRRNRLGLRPFGGVRGFTSRGPMIGSGAR